MANPNATQEPSMEEILASIRQIISEDGPSESTAPRMTTPAPAAPTPTGAAPTPAPSAPTAPAQRLDPEPWNAGPSLKPDPDAAAGSGGQYATSQKPHTAPVVSVSTPAAPAAKPVPHAAPLRATPTETKAAPAGGGSPAGAWQPAVVKTPASAERGVAPAQLPADRALLSDEGGAAVAGAFDALTRTMLAQSSRSLEEVVGEMLRPMLRTWLDDNLPSLVERLVRDEIERVSRGRR